MPRRLGLSADRRELGLVDPGALVAGPAAAPVKRATWADKVATSPSMVAEARDAGEAIKLAQAHAPEVILLDNHLPGVHGVEALPQLLAVAPDARIVMLTVSEDADDLAQALARGAAGYLLKTVEGDELIASIFRVRAGESVVSPEMTSKLIAAYRQALGTPGEQVHDLASPVQPVPPAHWPHCDDHANAAHQRASGAG